MNTALTIDFSPILSHGLLYGMTAVALALFVLSFFFYRRGLVFRTLCAAAFILLFLNPSVIEEQREMVPDVAVIVADHSPSQQNGHRMERTDAARDWLKAKLAALPGLEVRVIDSDSGIVRETRLFDKIDQALSDVPAGRRAGVILLTDGQVHDIPADARRFGDYGPVHALLSGDKKEHDRQLVILEAPSYGIVGQNATISYRIEENPGGDIATLLLRQNGAVPVIDTVPVNTDQNIKVTIDHAGQNIFDLEISPAADEITQANNRVPIIVNGVRDRLRVLLVSGQPHAGGRTWRNLLTSDPGVDLVHFTILREPDKLDATPHNGVSADCLSV